VGYSLTVYHAFLCDRCGRCDRGGPCDGRKHTSSSMRLAALARARWEKEKHEVQNQTCPISLCSPPSPPSSLSSVTVVTVVPWPARPTRPAVVTIVPVVSWCTSLAARPTGSSLLVQIGYGMLQVFEVGLFLCDAALRRRQAVLEPGDLFRGLHRNVHGRAGGG
jgi:hypothetical protein